MEILGTRFSLTLGSWRLRLVLAIEETEGVAIREHAPLHHLTVIKDSNHARSAER